MSLSDDDRALLEKLSPNSIWKMILPGLIAGLIAWGGMSVRVGQIEERAKEDRLLLREALEGFRTEVVKLRIDLQTEREQRLIDQAQTHEPRRVVPVFPNGHGRFDK